jgi:hypothetical protein
MVRTCCSDSWNTFTQRHHYSNLYTWIIWHVITEKLRGLARKSFTVQSMGFVTTTSPTCGQRMQYLYTLEIWCWTPYWCCIQYDWAHVKTQHPSLPITMMWRRKKQCSLPAVVMKIYIFLNITTCSQLKVKRRSEEHSASAFCVEEWATQETSMKQIARMFFRNVRWLSTDLKCDYLLS